MRRHRLKFNKENNLWYFETRVLWFKWKCLAFDANMGMSRVKAQATLYIQAKVVETSR